MESGVGEASMKAIPGNIYKSILGHTPTLPTHK